MPPTRTRNADKYRNPRCSFPGLALRSRRRRDSLPDQHPIAQDGADVGSRRERLPNIFGARLPEGAILLLGTNRPTVELQPALRTKPRTKGAASRSFPRSARAAAHIGVGAVLVANLSCKPNARLTSTCDRDYGFRLQPNCFLRRLPSLIVIVDRAPVTAQPADDPSRKSHHAPIELQPRAERPAEEADGNTVDEKPRRRKRDRSPRGKATPRKPQAKPPTKKASRERPGRGRSGTPSGSFHGCRGNHLGTRRASAPDHAPSRAGQGDGSGGRWHRQGALASGAQGDAGHRPRARGRAPWGWTRRASKKQD